VAFCAPRIGSSIRQKKANMVIQRIGQTIRGIQNLSF